MPELPEVEVVRRTLLPIVGSRVTGVWGSGQPLHMNRPVDLDAIRAASVGGVVEEIRRWGKYLMLDFVDRPHFILIHLGMTGRLSRTAATATRASHTHIVFYLERDREMVELRYSDPRRFGQLSLAERGRERLHPALAKLGPDPLGQAITGDYLWSRTRGSNRHIKTLLIEQSLVAGIGNIYASEALWRARIQPTARANRLSRQRLDALAEAIAHVLARALRHGGTTLRDFVAADGAQGQHFQYLTVYARAGQTCARRECAGQIRRQVVQGRATFFCPRCQRR